MLKGHSISPPVTFQTTRRLKMKGVINFIINYESFQQDHRVEKKLQLQHTKMMSNDSLPLSRRISHLYQQQNCNVMDQHPSGQ